MAQSDGFLASSSPPPPASARHRCSVVPVRRCAVCAYASASPSPHGPPSIKKKMSSPARQHEQGSASASPSLAYYRSILMPDVIEVIGVQVRGSIIAEHLHIDVHSDIGSGPSSSQVL